MCWLRICSIYHLLLLGERCLKGTLRWRLSLNFVRWDGSPQRFCSYAILHSGNPSTQVHGVATILNPKQLPHWKLLAVFFTQCQSESSESIRRHTLVPPLFSTSRSTLPTPLMMLEHPQMHSLMLFILLYFLHLVVWPSLWVILMFENPVQSSVHAAPRSWMRTVYNFSTSVFAVI